MSQACLDSHKVLFLLLGFFFLLVVVVVFHLLLSLMGQGRLGDLMPFSLGECFGWFLGRSIGWAFLLVIRNSV